MEKRVVEHDGKDPLLVRLTQAVHAHEAGTDSAHAAPQVERREDPSVRFRARATAPADDAPATAAQLHDLRRVLGLVETRLDATRAQVSAAGLRAAAAQGATEGSAAAQTALRTGFDALVDQVARLQYGLDALVADQEAHQAQVEERLDALAKKVTAQAGQITRLRNELKRRDPAEPAPDEPKRRRPGTG